MRQWNVHKEHVHKEQFIWRANGYNVLLYDDNEKDHKIGKEIVLVNCKHKFVLNCIKTKTSITVPRRITRGRIWRFPLKKKFDQNKVRSHHLSPRTLTDKMASENSPQSMHDQTALIETDPEEEQECSSIPHRSGYKLTLYHWTQSFNSQKVSAFLFSAPQSRGQLRAKDGDKYLGCNA